MSTKIIKTSFLVTFVLFMGYVVSFVKEMIIASEFGISSDVDAYTLAITIPVNLFSLIAVSIQPIVIPIYSKVLYGEGQEEAKKYIDSFISLVIIISVIFVILIEIFAEPIAFIFAPGLDSEARNLVAILLRITTPTILFSLVDRVFIGVLNVHKSFVLPALAIYFLNIGIITSIVILHAKWGIYSACFGQVFGSIMQVLFLVIIAKKYYKFSFSKNFRNGYIAQTLKGILPVIFSTSISEINVLINRAVASFLFAGAISALAYSNRVNYVLIMFFTHAISTIIFPMYAEAAVKKDMKVLNTRINFTLSVYTYFLLPLMAVVIILRKELIALAFGRGAFDQDAVDLTSSLLGCYSIGIVFFALRETITKVFFSLEDTKTPAKNSSIGLFLNIVLSLTLPLILGVEGLALASSFSVVFISISLIIRLLIKYPILNLGMFFANLKQMLLPLIFSVICTFIIYSVLSNYTPIFILLGCSLTVSLIYVLTSYFLKVTIFMMFVNKIFKRF